MSEHRIEMSYVGPDAARNAFDGCFADMARAVPLDVSLKVMEAYHALDLGHARVGEGSGHSNREAAAHLILHRDAPHFSFHYGDYDVSRAMFPKELLESLDDWAAGDAGWRSMLGEYRAREAEHVDWGRAIGLVSTLSEDVHRAVLRWEPGTARAWLEFPSQTALDAFVDDVRSYAEAKPSLAEKLVGLGVLPAEPSPTTGP